MKKLGVLIGTAKGVIEALEEPRLEASASIGRSRIHG
jgi:hypothetical protein